MRVTVCFGQTRVVVPCKGGATVAELVKEACARYKKAIGKEPVYWVRIRQLENAVDGGILDVDDFVHDVAEDRDQLIAIFDEEEDQTYRYNEWDRMDGDFGSDGYRSPQPIHDQTAVHNGFGEGNTGSNSIVTLRDPMVVDNEDRGKSRVKKTFVPSYYCGRREPGSGQEEDYHATPWDRDRRRREMTATTGSNLPEHNSGVLAAGSDTNVSSDSGHHSIKNMYDKHSGKNGNFARIAKTKSMMEMLSENHDYGCNNARPPPDGRKQSSLDLEEQRSPYAAYQTERHFPPSPDDQSIYPPFYNRSQEIFIDLDQRPLGIKVTSYKEKTAFFGLLVESLDKEGRSQREKLFKEGDVIVEVNSYILAQYTLTVAQEIFKRSMKFPQIQLRVYSIGEREKVLLHNSTMDTSNESLKRHRYTPSIPVITVGEPTLSKPTKISPAKSLPNLSASTTSKSSRNAKQSEKQSLATRSSLDTVLTNTGKIGNMFEIELRKGEQGLGFSISTRNIPVGEPGPVYIKNILPKGAAIQDGRLHAGDRLLEVDNIEMTGHTQESAVNILRCIAVGSTVRLLVSRQVNTLPRKMKDDPIADEVLGDYSDREYFKFEIALNDTGSAGLGISLKGNQNKISKKDLGIFVKSVFHGGAAYQDGRLQANDQLVSVNGQSLIGMTNHEAIDTLRTSMSTVGNVRGMIQMEICRRVNPTEGEQKDTTAYPQYSSEASSEISNLLANKRNFKLPFEISERSREENFFGDDSFQYSENLHELSDLKPLYESYNDPFKYNGDDWTDSSYPQDSEVDSFAREPVFTRSNVEMQLGAVSRDNGDSDTTPSEMMQSAPMKRAQPTAAKRNHSANSTRRSPVAVRKNLNRSSNLPSRTPVTTLQSEVAVGPTLGIAKSSSLESLQTAIENFTDSDNDHFPKPQQRVLRGRVFNDSFRAALDQSYDLDNFKAKSMLTLKENNQNGTEISPLAKPGTKIHEKKRGGKSYKIFGLFRVGKNKRSSSSDRTIDSCSSSSSSRLTESEVHMKLLEEKKSDDFRKHKEESERIKAKAKVMREEQEKQRKRDEDRKKLRGEPTDSNQEYVRSPSVPVTAMQRVHLDPKVSDFNAPSVRQSADPLAMSNNSQKQNFDWRPSKQPTSPVKDVEPTRRRRPEKKSRGNQTKITPDYSSLPRQQSSERDERRIRDSPDSTVTSRNNGTNSGQRWNGLFNNGLYKNPKPPTSNMRSTQSMQTNSEKSEFHRQRRPERPKSGRALFLGDAEESTLPYASDMMQSQPRLRKDVLPTSNNGLGLITNAKTRNRRNNREPSAVLHGQHQSTSTPVAKEYNQSAPLRRNDRHHRHATSPSGRKRIEQSSFT